MRYYDALGFPPTLTLDADELKRRFYERSREWHPDRFSRRGAEEQKKALEMTAVLNDAFRVLRDPVSRAEYFLEQRQMPPTKNPPPELLEEVFELNMTLEELRGGEESARGQLTEARERFLKMRQQIDEGMAALFTRFDKANGEETARETLGEIRAALDRRRYISNLLRDVNKELDRGEELDQQPDREPNVHLSN